MFVLERTRISQERVQTTCGSLCCCLFACTQQHNSLDEKSDLIAKKWFVFHKQPVDQSKMGKHTVFQKLCCLSRETRMTKKGACHGGSALDALSWDCLLNVVGDNHIVTKEKSGSDSTQVHKEQPEHSCHTHKKPAVGCCLQIPQWQIFVVLAFGVNQCISEIPANKFNGCLTLSCKLHKHGLCVFACMAWFLSLKWLFTQLVCFREKGQKKVEKHRSSCHCVFACALNDTIHHKEVNEEENKSPNNMMVNQ